MQLGNGRNWEAGAKLLKLALALHRKELTEKPDAELSEAMQMLLRLANGDAELMAWATQVTGAAAEEVHRCSIAFIEREFFSGDADPYGVLGLTPWASAADIKEHYRLLIRLFHPDRGLVNSSSAETYAAMINQAYAELKKPVFADADTSALSKPAPAVAFRADIAPSLRRHVTRSIASESIGLEAWGWVSRLTPAKVLFSLAFMATLIVAMLFLQQNRPKVISLDATVDTRSNASDFTTPLETEQQVREAVPMPEISSVAPLPAAPVLAEETSQAARSQEMLREKNEVAEPVKPPLKKRVATTVTASVVSLDDSHMLSVPVAEDAVTPIAVTNNQVNHVNSDTPQTNSENGYDNDVDSLADTKISQTPSDRELHDLIAHFMGSYQRGDVSEFMQVFDERVRTDEVGGKRGLQNAYARFFSNTLSRSMILKDLQWKRSGVLAIGQAEYRASTSRADAVEPSTSSGTLRFEVSKTGADVMIVGFYHQAVKK